MTRPLITTDPTVKPRKLRRAGARWRLLVHRIVAGGMSDHAYHIQSEPDRKPNLSQWSSTQVVAGTEFDELVVGEWLHIEQMDIGIWWMNIAGVTVHVTVSRDGRPRVVTVHGPLDYEGETRPGVTYECQWTDPAAIPDPPTKELSNR
jgi:hypothetical protein